MEEQIPKKSPHITDSLPAVERLTVTDYNDLLEYLQKAAEQFKNIKTLKVK